MNMTGLCFIKSAYIVHINFNHELLVFDANNLVTVFFLGYKCKHMIYTLKIMTWNMIFVQCLFLFYTVGGKYLFSTFYFC